MPSQEGVRREHRADLFQDLAAQDLAFDGQTPALVVTEQDPILAEFFLEHLDFGSQELDPKLLLFMDPASEDNQQHLPRMKNEIHGTPRGLTQAFRSRRRSS